MWKYSNCDDVACRRERWDATDPELVWRWGHTFRVSILYHLIEETSRNRESAKLESVFVEFLKFSWCLLAGERWDATDPELLRCWGHPFRVRAPGHHQAEASRRKHPALSSADRAAGPVHQERHRRSSAVPTPSQTGRGIQAVCIMCN